MPYFEIFENCGASSGGLEVWTLEVLIVCYKSMGNICRVNGNQNRSFRNRENKRVVGVINLSLGGSRSVFCEILLEDLLGDDDKIV